MNELKRHKLTPTSPRTDLNTRVVSQVRPMLGGARLAETTVLNVVCDVQPAAFDQPNAEHINTEGLQDAWPTERLPHTSLQPRQKNQDGKYISGAMRVVGFPLFGLTEARLRAALKQIERLQKTHEKFIPVVFTDFQDHSILRRANVILEYFPAAAYSSAEQDGLFNKRFRDLCRKWNLKHFVDLGKPGLLRERLEDYDTYFRAALDGKAPFDPRKKAPPLPVPVVTDIVSLEAEYLTKGLDQEADTFVLYRILGNDLPPRHESGQMLSNLAFILENEPKLPCCEKRWVVNRIVDTDIERAAIELLEKFDQPYLHIPFVLDDYREVEWDLESFPQGNFFLSGKYAEMSKSDQLRAQAHSRRHKNRYIMNNNGARNAALRDGRDHAKWVLPWDGNCFVTKHAWSQIRTEVTKAPHLKYFTVPMARVTDNADLLKRGYSPDAVEEPQLIFRKDASEEFDPQSHYGRRPKVELFWRLGIPGPWDQWSDDIWDSARPARASEAGEFGNAGWVARLQSGRNDLEEASTDALVGRGLARASAISSIIDRVDQNVLKLGLDPMALTAYNDELIASLSLAPKDTEKGRLHDRLLQEADLALQRGPYSVTDKTTLPPSGDRQDYYHPSPYWWPATDSPSEVRMVYRDGLRAPGTRLYEKESDRYDRTRLQKLFDDTTFLALAGAASSEPDYHRHATKLVRHWFIDAQTRMNPHLEFAQFVPNSETATGSSSGLIEMKDLYFFLDAVRLLERSGTFTAQDKAQFSAWLRDYVSWLQESPQGVAEAGKKNNHGTYYDLQVGAIAAYLGDTEILSAVFRRSRERIAIQFERSGSQKHELTRTQTQHYCAFNLQAWAHLANLADSCGDRLWDYTGPGGRSLAGAFKWLLSKQSDKTWAYKQISPFDKDRFLPLIFVAKAQFTRANAVSAAFGFGRKPIFFPHDGIMPFWMLSRMIAASGGHADKLLTNQITRAERVAGQRNAYNATNVETTKALETQMWGGYSTYAQKGLEQLKSRESAPNKNRADAAWILARWHSFCGEFSAAMENIQTAKSLNPGHHRGYALAEATFLIELGQPEAARKILTDMLQHMPDDPNLFLLIANTFIRDPKCIPSTAESQTLSWINKVYLTRGAAGLQKRDPNAPLDMFNIIGQNVPELGAVDTNTPKVSVVMPVYNGADTIGNAISSVQAQSWRNLQILVVDDCSTDETRDIVRKISASDPRVELLSMRDNRGAYVARNAGMDIAKGDYVTVHDSDDWSHPQKIEFQLKQLKNTRGAVGVLSRWTRLRPNLFTEGYWRLAENLIGENQSSFLFPRSMLTEVGPWDNVRAGADNEFIWRFRMRFGDSAIVETDRELPMSFGLVRPESLTRQGVTHVRTVYHGLRKDYRRTYRRWQKSGDPDELVFSRTQLDTRQFAAPVPILPMGHKETRKFKHVFIADFSEKATRIDLAIAAITRATEQSDSIGVFHWPDYETTSDATFHPEIGALLDSFKIEQISAWQASETETLTLCDPLLTHYKIEGLPDFGVNELDVLCQFSGAEGVVLDPRRRRMPTQVDLEEVFGMKCKWVHFDFP